MQGFYQASLYLRVWRLSIRSLYLAVETFGLEMETLWRLLATLSSP